VYFSSHKRAFSRINFPSNREKERKGRYSVCGQLFGRKTIALVISEMFCAEEVTSRHFHFHNGTRCSHDVLMQYVSQALGEL